MYSNQESRLIAVERRNMVAAVLRRRFHREARQRRHAQSAHAPVAAAVNA